MISKVDQGSVWVDADDSCDEPRELLVDAGWLFLLNACVQYDRDRREAANLRKAAALRIGDEAGHGEIKVTITRGASTPGLPF
ncbi:hypothetical protein [Streptomyces solicathayae]|uniref:Uncharacterized protein n=1 Tax=Streptomyces solicathayae TaxID=3081768 RepID=A0ABZ0LTI8_9ACTN|nr:hypothetical protein [Streptomyces sp. HUAS YS2]WOX22810.1 hypothetical protein R2D22_15955 [Streptomyces sp. HUAS YS2]